MTDSNAVSAAAPTRVHSGAPFLPASAPVRAHQPRVAGSTRPFAADSAEKRTAFPTVQIAEGATLRAPQASGVRGVVLAQTNQVDQLVEDLRKNLKGGLFGIGKKNRQRFGNALVRASQLPPAQRHAVAARVESLEVRGDRFFDRAIDKMEAHRPLIRQFVLDNLYNRPDYSVAQRLSRIESLYGQPRNWQSQHGTQMAALLQSTPREQQAELILRLKQGSFNRVRATLGERASILTDMEMAALYNRPDYTVAQRMERLEDLTRGSDNAAAKMEALYASTPTSGEQGRSAFVHAVDEADLTTKTYGLLGVESRADFADRLFADGFDRADLSVNQRVARFQKSLGYAGDLAAHRGHQMAALIARAPSAQHRELAEALATSRAGRTALIDAAYALAPETAAPFFDANIFSASHTDEARAQWVRNVANRAQTLRPEHRNQMLSLFAGQTGAGFANALSNEALFDDVVRFSSRADAPELAQQLLAMVPSLEDSTGMGRAIRAFGFDVDGTLTVLRNVTEARGAEVSGAAAKAMADQGAFPFMRFTYPSAPRDDVDTEAAFVAQSRQFQQRFDQNTASFNHLYEGLAPSAGREALRGDFAAGHQQTALDQANDVIYDRLLAHQHIQTRAASFPEFIDVGVPEYRDLGRRYRAEFLRATDRGQSFDAIDATYGRVHAEYQGKVELVREFAILADRFPRTQLGNYYRAQFENSFTLGMSQRQLQNSYSRVMTAHNDEVRRRDELDRVFHRQVRRMERSDVPREYVREFRRYFSYDRSTWDLERKADRLIRKWADVKSHFNSRLQQLPRQGNYRQRFQNEFNRRRGTISRRDIDRIFNRLMDEHRRNQPPPGGGNRRPGGNNPPGGGNRRPGGSNPPGGGNRRPGGTNPPGGGNRRPGGDSGNRQPNGNTGGNRRPTGGNRQPNGNTQGNRRPGQRTGQRKPQQGQPRRPQRGTDGKETRESAADRARERAKRRAAASDS